MIHWTCKLTVALLHSMTLKWGLRVTLSLLSFTRAHVHARTHARAHTHTHTHTTILQPSWILSRTTQVSRHSALERSNQSGFTGARDSEWQWHQLGHMQICSVTQTRHITMPTSQFIAPLSFFTGRMPFLPPNQQRQSTEGSYKGTCHILLLCINTSLFRMVYRIWPHFLCQIAMARFRNVQTIHKNRLNWSLKVNSTVRYVVKALMRWQKGHPAHKNNLCHLFAKVMFQNEMKKTTHGEPGLMLKHCKKNRRTREHK